MTSRWLVEFLDTVRATACLSQPGLVRRAAQLRLQRQVKTTTESVARRIPTTISPPPTTAQITDERCAFARVTQTNPTHAAQGPATAAMTPRAACSDGYVHSCGITRDPTNAMTSSPAIPTNNTLPGEAFRAASTRPNDTEGNRSIRARTHSDNRRLNKTAPTHTTAIADITNTPIRMPRMPPPTRETPLTTHALTPNFPPVVPPTENRLWRTGHSQFTASTHWSNGSRHLAANAPRA